MASKLITSLFTIHVYTNDPAKVYVSLICLAVQAVLAVLF